MYIIIVLTGPYSLTCYMDHYYIHGGPLKIFLFNQYSRKMGWDGCYLDLFVNMVHSYLSKVPGLK